MLSMSHGKTPRPVHRRLQKIGWATGLAGIAVALTLLQGCGEPLLKPDTKPLFGKDSVSDVGYKLGVRITNVRLPAATGGNAPVTYTLTPKVPGLSLNDATRVLSGTPTAEGRYAVTYRARDKDGDSTMQSFAIVVTEEDISFEAPVSGSLDPSSDDQDTFAVTVTSGGILLAATVKDYPSGHTGTVVRIRGVAGHPTNQDYIDGVEVDPGVYYVEVALKSGAQAGDYELAVWLIDPDSDFDIDLRYDDPGPTEAQRQAFKTAAEFWEDAITGDLTYSVITDWELKCEGDYGDSIRFGDTIDDLTLHVIIDDIDGAGGTLAQAGPCYVRDTLKGLPSIGIMIFDTADLATVDLEAVAIHEMAHILGFGTLWSNLDREFDFLQDPSIISCESFLSKDTYFNGPLAIAAFSEIDIISYTGNIVPVENDTGTYGCGSLDSHWRESVFDTELMTPSLDATPPLSSVTIASLKDMGYQVNADAADDYTLPQPGSNLEGVRGGIVDLSGDVLPGPPLVLELPADIERLLGR